METGIEKLESNPKKDCGETPTVICDNPLRREFLRPPWRLHARTIVLASGAATTAYFLLTYPPPSAFILSGFLAGASLLAAAILGADREPPVVRLKGYAWNVWDFCRGWLISGDTGSGKTRSAVHTLMFQVFTNRPDWGGCIIDEKGNFHKTVEQMAAHFSRSRDLIVLSARPALSPKDWKPKWELNLVGDRNIPAQTYAEIIVETAVAQTQAQGTSKDHSFFKTQAQMHIGMAIEALIEGGYEVSLENAQELLLNEKDLRRVIGELRAAGKESSMKIASHFEERYLSQPPEQLGGVKGTIYNFLQPYSTPEIAEVFSRGSNFEFGKAIEEGKIVCLSISNRHKNERRYVATFLKRLFYLQALERFDRGGKERLKENLLILWADEYQHFISSDDFKYIDVIREAKATVVAATQSTTSLIPPLGRDQAKVVTLNLRNRIVFRAADEEDALQSADFIGKRPRMKVTRNTGKGGFSRSFAESDEHLIKPHELRQLRKYHCVVVHCEKRGFKKGVLPPIEPNGKRSGWF